MKIMRAWIDDPLRRGEDLAPGLCIETDEYPSQTNGFTTLVAGISVARYGPFVYKGDDEIVQKQIEGHWMVDTPRVPAERYNVLTAGLQPPVVDLTLFIDNEQYEEFAMPLLRARQLLRRDDPSWRLYLSDAVAQSGGMLWSPVENEAPCKHWYADTGSICGLLAVQTVQRNESSVPMPLCRRHLQNYNQSFATARSSSQYGV